MNRRPCYLMLLALLTTAGLPLVEGFQDAPALPPPATAQVEFLKDVEPLLRTRCYACHGPVLQQSGLRLDRKDAAMAGGYSGTVIKPGASDESSLVHRLAGAKDLMVMPPSGQRLSPEQIGIFRAWIDQGAKWTAVSPTSPERVTPVRKSHWSFQPVSKPAVPKPRDSEWVRNPIDAFILARLEKEAVQPSPQAEKRTVVRRVSLDLTGLPPTPKELADFLADRRPDAYERQVDRLLASPHFGEKWARHWLDRARYADSDGYEKDWVRPHAWRYRQWVIEALNRDLPFDRFTIEQIAGDLLPNATVEEKVATGFHRNTLTNREGGVDNNQFQFENALDRSNTVAAVWMGLTAGCAQCHDHKYDPISQKEHYQLFAFFDNLEEVDIDAALPGETEPWLRTRPEYESKREALLKEYKVDSLQAGWEREMLDAFANPGKRTDWDLAWDCLLKLTEGGDGERIIRTAPDRRTLRDRDVLTTHFIRNYHFAVGPKNFGEVKFKELDGKLNELKASYPQLSQAMTVAEAGQKQPSHLRVRGNYKTLGIEVEPGGLAVLPPLLPGPGNRTATRLDLAQWLVSPKHPLTSRVAVNWIWQELFGQGLVKSSDDFGTRGDKPTHPELLDWLASDFSEQPRSIKRLIRTIVTSAAYRQESKERPELKSIDPGNSLLARQSRLRLPAELIRDSVLRASGLLSEQIGGPSVRPPQPDGVSELGYGNRKENGAWIVSEGRQRYRRGLYIHFQRSTPYPLLVNFDAPKANVALCRRQRSSTPLQALNLLNDPVFMESAEALAREVLKEQGTFGDRLRDAYMRTVAREPGANETKRFSEYFELQRRIFANEPESLKRFGSFGATGLGPVDYAAWVALSSVLLNTDEFINRE